MAWILHPRTTALMAAFYAAVSAILLYFISDMMTIAVALFVLFTLVLLAGNMYLRAGARRSGQGAAGTKGGRASQGLPYDPEAGRR